MSDVDINSLELLNEPVEVDGSVNSEAFFRPPLPDDGDHLAILKLGDRGIKVDRQRDESGEKRGKPFLQVHLAEELIDATGAKVGMAFDQVTSVLMPNTGTTKLHAILDICGDPAPARCTLGDLLAHTEQVFAQSPRATVTTQWEASTKADSQDSVNRAISLGLAKSGKLGVGDYYTILRGQKKFPPILDEDGKPSGKFESEIEDPVGGEKVRAQVRVLRYKRA